MREIQKVTLELISSVNSEEGPKLVGILVTRERKPTYNFSLFDVTEDEIVLSIQIGDVLIYLGFESDEEIDEDEYPELVESLIHRVLPGVKNLIKEIKKADIREPMILYDAMGPDLKEVFYDLLMKHMRGESVYEQTEVA